MHDHRVTFELFFSPRILQETTIGSFAHDAKGNDGKCAKKIAKLEVEFYTFLALI